MVLNHIISPHTHAHIGGRIKTILVGLERMKTKI